MSGAVLRLLEAAEELRAWADAPSGPPIPYEVAKVVEALVPARLQIETLLQERCYICRPGVAGVLEEGCADCDEKAGLYAQIETLTKERDDILAHDAEACRMFVAAEADIKKLTTEVARLRDGIREIAAWLTKQHPAYDVAAALLEEGK